MARGKRIPVEEKINAKKELIESLTKRLESEKAELKELTQEKEQLELAELNEILHSAGIKASEAAAILKEYAKDNSQK